MRSIRDKASAQWQTPAMFIPALLLAVVACTAHAQSPAVRHIHGVLQSVTADALSLKTERGDTVSVGITDKTPVVLGSPTSFDAIKPGSYIGTAAVPGAVPM